MCFYLRALWYYEVFAIVYNPHRTEFYSHFLPDEIKDEKDLLILCRMK